MATVRYQTANVDGLKVFYRQAGAAHAPKLLLLHGIARGQLDLEHQVEP